MMQQTGVRQPRAVTTTAMRRLPPPQTAQPARQVPANQVPSAQDMEQVVEALRVQVNELEARLAALEAVISFQNQDLVINAPHNILIQAQGDVEVSAAARFQVAASFTEASTTLAKVSGTVQCDTLIATNVIGSSYTPGAGNIW